MYIIVSLAGCVAVHDLLYIPFFPFAAGDCSITREEAGMEGMGGSVTPEWPASVEVVGSVTEDGPGTEGVEALSLLNGQRQWRWWGQSLRMVQARREWRLCHS